MDKMVIKYQPFHYKLINHEIKKITSFYLIRPHLQKKIKDNAQTTEGHHSSVCQGKYMPNDIKGNAEK